MGSAAPDPFAALPKQSTVRTQYGYQSAKGNAAAPARIRAAGGRAAELLKKIERLEQEMSIPSSDSDDVRYCREAIEGFIEELKPLGFDVRWSRGSGVH